MEKGLIKGPWSPQEDEILKEYVRIHGPKNWNGLKRVTGLPRDGKSCRLRWLNHLDPYFKKGKLSEEEKQKILQLGQLKTPWCEIVKQIHGRTDNEIKNFWNINERKKRKMENGNGEYLKKKNKILKPHHELNNNGESRNQQQHIDWSETCFISNNMESGLPPLQESYFISKDMESGLPLLEESYFISKDMESNLPLLQDQSFESLIQMYHPLPLRSSKEIQQEQLELNSLFNNNNVLEYMCWNPESDGNQHSCETRLVDENGKKSTYLKKDESNCETRLFDENGMKSTYLEKDESNYETRLVDENEMKSTYLEKDESNCETRLVDENEMKSTYLQKDESNCETRLVDENGMKPTYLKNDESNNEDLIDLLYGLGWLDGYIF